ncbi:hypothetical protein Golax_022551, partial [Gossypium laxum]|nr:hypothetical protein [Gossypium laxum]
MFPGPTLEIKNGDTLEVQVVNKARYNVTIHCVRLDREEVTLTDLQFKDKKEHCGGMLTVHGLEP